jgi:hypothetical protein
VLLIASDELRQAPEAGYRILPMDGWLAVWHYFGRGEIFCTLK